MIFLRERPTVCVTRWWVGRRHFAGTHFKPRKLPENAQTPTRRAHALLAGFMECKTRHLKEDSMANMHHDEFDHRNLEHML